MKEKRIAVAGEIDFVLGSFDLEKLTETEIILNEFVGFLHCFLYGNVYPGSRDKVQEIVEEILINAQLSDHCLFFSFPKNIAKKFLLDDQYEFPLIRGAALKIYAEKWMPQGRLACQITVHEDAPLHGEIVQRLQEIVLQSKKRPKKIVVGKNRRTNMYDIRITFVRDTHKMIRDAVQDVQDAVSCVAAHLG